jgi:hypothetical protein
MALPLSVGDFASLISDYGIMLNTTMLRSLLTSVDQDPKNETVNLEKSKITVRKKIEAIPSTSVDTYEKTRRDVISWLNRVWFVSIAAGSDRADEASRELFRRFMWENHTRLQKVFIVSMIMEGRNLKSMGGVPEKADIPQSLVYLPLLIAEMRKAIFPQMEKQFEAEVSKLEEVYVSLYCDQ